MIFSNSKAELYWIFSILLPNYDISIIKKILDLKNKLEYEDNILWHAKQGIALKRLKFCNASNISIFKEILFIPMQPELELFHLKILIETFGYPGFILKQISDNEYEVPTIKELSKTLNHYISKYGIYEIYSKLFHHTTNSITDNVGNKCIRSIICVKCDTDVHDTQSENTILYEYKTIAVEERIIESCKKRVYFEPVERRPRMI
tara:strand:+ start:1311 stop:1925 length:615 start_codon:yes stop_codon:yes gene_type:complete